ncbi:steroidogenic factor 1 [Canna indica]|uniref:Steroidogenic factor 1 n=1 Tax=Canna indica TaxID=4628 RepID=A0AAQ3K646_9LILI|nr:steroidogenic factor 1 [Canna indica]
MNFRARCPFILLLSLCCCFIFCFSAANGVVKQQQPSVLVIGTVYCDTCFPQALSKPTHFISGASVAIECGDAASDLGYRTVVTTDRRGVFRARLPPKISKHARLIEACSVKLIKSNEPFCAVASSATTAGRLRLKSRRHGLHVYSAGFFSFKPLTQPEMCYQSPALFDDHKQEQTGGFFIPLPTISFFPSPPNTGGAQLPSNPFFPPQVNPLQPPPTSSASGAQLPTNPFLPPQSTLGEASLPANPLFPPRTSPLEQPPSTTGGASLPANPLFPPRINPFQPPTGGASLPANPLFPPRTNPLQSPPSSIGGASLPANPLFPPRTNPIQPPSLGWLPFRRQPPSTPTSNFPPVVSVTAGPPPAAAVLPFRPSNPFVSFPRFPGAPPAFSSKEASP